MGFEGIILTMAASPDLTNLGASSIDLPDRRSIFSRRVSNLQATAKENSQLPHNVGEDRQKKQEGKRKTRAKREQREKGKRRTMSSVAIENGRVTSSNLSGVVEDNLRNAE